MDKATIDGKRGRVMTIEEANTFLDNLKVCVEEHPIVADWLVEIADRNTENSSEKPNNCEDLQDWKDRMWAEAVIEPQTEECPFDDPIPCEWVNCPNSTDCPYKQKTERSSE